MYFYIGFPEVFMGKVPYFILAATLILIGCGKKEDPRMVNLPAGCYQMGAIESDTQSQPYETPQHQVCLDAFSIDIYEVTQAEFSSQMGFNPTDFKGCDNCPADNMTWTNASDYCAKVGKRLPTEAEWEYAARAGTETIFYWGQEYLDSYTWNAHNSEQKTHPVKTTLPNAWGLYDMAGNVSEWVSDWYAADYYTDLIAQGRNPLGPKEGVDKAVRGGSWKGRPYQHRSSARSWKFWQHSNNTIGFRCAKNTSN
jgi:formylglycine-generating enzyme required for sulfatase activity